MRAKTKMPRMIAIFLLGLMVGSSSASAQNSPDVVWVQIEAQPSLEEALERIEIYERTLPDVNGFAMPGGWFSITLGPYEREDAELVLRSFRSSGRIPSDSYIALNSAYQTQYWPEGADLLNLGTLALPNALAEQTPVPSFETVQTELSVQSLAGTQVDPETRAEARRSEALLTAQEKRDLQTALAWAGFYRSGIDGSFGRGTRNAMAAWQSANGFEATGILTTRQRAALMESYNAPLEGLGLERVRDQAAGIEIKLPTDLVAFDRYQPPFAQYNSTQNSAARVLLISQAGNRATLASLFEVMQSLEIVPLEGPRRLNRNGFSLIGEDERIVSETRVRLENGQIKGFTLVWPAGDEERRARVLDEMDTSFVSLDGVLDPSLGGQSAQSVDMIAGLDLRKPIQSRSGFFVDQAGAVITTADAVANCKRITLDDLYEATLSELDTERGLAILRPDQSLAPPAVAEFTVDQPTLQTEVAVVGYSFEGQLTSPSVTFGTLSDVKGLSGEMNWNRLSINALPGDEGGPVFDDRGQVMGMLVPQPGGSRQLPDDVRFALNSASIEDALANAGVSATKGAGSERLAPEDINARGVGMTVLVSCWG